MQKSETFLRFWGDFWARLMDFRPKSCHQRMSLRGRRRTKLRFYKHPIIASVFNFVHFLRESTKIGDISSSLGGFLSTVNGFPTKMQSATNQLARPKWTKIRFTTIQSYRPPPNLCVLGIKVLKSGTILRFWGIFWTRLRRSATRTHSQGRMRLRDRSTTKPSQN